MELNQGAEHLLLYQILVGCKHVLLAVLKNLQSTKNIKHVPNKPTWKYVIKVMRIVYLTCFLQMAELSDENIPPQSLS